MECLKGVVAHRSSAYHVTIKEIDCNHSSGGLFGARFIAMAAVHTLAPRRDAILAGGTTLVTLRATLPFVADYLATLHC